MDWTGKKTQKLHIRLTEDVAREVRATAELEHRPIQDQMMILIVRGLQASQLGVYGLNAEAGRAAPQDAAETVQPAPPIAAVRRTVPHRKERMG